MTIRLILAVIVFMSSSSVASGDADFEPREEFCQFFQKNISANMQLILDFSNEMQRVHKEFKNGKITQKEKVEQISNWSEMRASYIRELIEYAPIYEAYCDN